MGWCGDEHEGLDADDLNAEPVGGAGVGQTHDGGVEFVAAEVLDERDGVVFPQRHLDPRVLLVERREQARQVDVGDPGNGPNAEPAADNASQSHQRRSSCFAGVERLAGVGEKRLAGGGEANGRGGAVEELLAELCFQPPDLLTDAGLGHVEPLGGAGEARLAGDSNQVGELA
jgi:hypothetical protein